MILQSYIHDTSNLRGGEESEINVGNCPYFPRVGDQF